MFFYVLCPLLLSKSSFNNYVHCSRIFQIVFSYLSGQSKGHPHRGGGEGERWATQAMLESLYCIPISLAFVMFQPVVVFDNKEVGPRAWCWSSNHVALFSRTRRPLEVSKISSTAKRRVTNVYASNFLIAKASHSSTMHVLINCVPTWRNSLKKIKGFAWR